MIKRIIKSYINLPLRTKMLVIGVFVLTSINSLHIAISFATSQTENSAQTEITIAQDKVDLARQLEVAGMRIESGKNLSIVTFLVGAIPGDVADPEDLSGPFVITLQNQLTELDSADALIAEFRAPAEDGTELDKTELQHVEIVESKLADYRIVINEIVEVQIPLHGDTETGLGGELMDSLRIINETVDASNAMALATNYIINFQQDIVLQIPSEIGSLKTQINEADISDTEREDLLAEVDKAQATYLALVNHDIELSKNAGALTTIIEETNDEVRTLIDYEFANESDAQAKLDDAKTLRFQLQILSAALTILVGMTVAFFVSRLITNPLTRLTRNAERIAQGDYSQILSDHRDDEVGRLSSAFNQMTEAVRQKNKSLEAQAEELRLAKNEAEESTRLKSEFLATMSHELRTPLNAIEGFASIMLAGMGVELSPDAYSMVERISANSARLVELVNDVLDISRIEAGRIEINYEPLVVEDLVKRWDQEIRVVADSKSLEFTHEINPNLPATVLVDQHALNKIVLNLLTNAVKYTETGSIHLSLAQDNADWLIQVKDTGIGITPEAQTYIFEEFRQVDGSSKRRYGGVGLGLSIVQKLVRLLDGQITLKSKLGEGSTFTVRLPLKSDTAETKE